MGGRHTPIPLRFDAHGLKTTSLYSFGNHLSSEISHVYRSAYPYRRLPYHINFRVTSKLSNTHIYNRGIIAARETRRRAAAIGRAAADLKTNCSCSGVVDLDGEGVDADEVKDDEATKREDT